MNKAKNFTVLCLATPRVCVSRVRHCSSARNQSPIVALQLMRFPLPNVPFCTGGRQPRLRKTHFVCRCQGNCRLPGSHRSQSYDKLSMQHKRRGGIWNRILFVNPVTPKVIVQVHFKILRHFNSWPSARPAYNRERHLSAWSVYWKRWCFLKYRQAGYEDKCPTVPILPRPLETKTPTPASNQKRPVSQARQLHSTNRACRIGG